MKNMKIGISVILIVQIVSCQPEMMRLVNNCSPQYKARLTFCPVSSWLLVVVAGYTWSSPGLTMFQSSASWPGAANRSKLNSTLPPNLLLTHRWKSVW